MRTPSDLRFKYCKPTRLNTILEVAVVFQTGLVFARARTSFKILEGARGQAAAKQISMIICIALYLDKESIFDMQSACSHRGPW